MPANNWIWEALGWAALPLVAVLAGVLLYRRFIAEFRVFFSYLIVTELVGVARLIGSKAPGATNFYVYWISDIIYSLFALMATFELFIKHLFPRFYKVRFYRYLFVIAALLTAFGSISIALISGRARVLVSTIYVYNMLRAAILVFFVFLMLAMGRQWKKLQLGIATGFALDVAASLAALGIWSHSPSWNGLIGRISAIAYDLACLIWLYCFSTSPMDPDTPPMESIPEEKLREAKEWEQSLKDFLHQDKN